MNRLLVILLISVVSFSASAQIVDSLAVPNSDVLLEKIRERANVAQIKDSLAITNWADSLHEKVFSKFSADSLRLTSKLDSLRSLGKSTESILSKLDSLSNKKNQLIREVEEKKQGLITKSKEKVNSWREKMESKAGMDPLDKIPADKTGVVAEKINEARAVVPDLDTSIDIPGIEGLSSLDALGEEFKLPSTDLPNVDLSPDLASLNKNFDIKHFDKFNNISEKVGIAGGQLGSLEEITSNPNGAIENIDQVADIKKELGGIDVIQDNEFMEAADMLKDPKAMKEEMKSVAVKKAVNHFEGKEEVLQQAMEKLSKYKQKYESLNSLSDLKKRPPNAMKGKPVIERIIPGVGLQILKNNDLLLDINPYVGYRISGRITSGLGWNQRIGYSLDNNYFTSPSVIYGPRLYGEVKGWRGFVFRAEGELVNSRVPPSTRRVTIDDGHRDWVRTAFVGIKKEYRFFGKVKGTAMIMFVVYNDHRKSPYGDVINSRFGFEFPMKKKSG